MPLKSPQNDPNSDADALSFPSLLLALVQGCISSDEEYRVTLPLYIAFQSDVRSFFHAIFAVVESNYMVGDWLRGTMCAILTTNNAELEDIDSTVGVKVLGEMRTLTSADIVEKIMSLGIQ